MKKQALAIAIASALAAPSAFAATDTSGMQYTSASEGFYASIRARYESGPNDFNGASIENGSSRIGVRGTNDLGGGLEGFYLYELGVGIDNGSGVETRMGHVGLRGAFGQIQAGGFWGQDYNWTHGSTDVANKHSGNLNYTDQRAGRVSKALEYTTPDLNGFQGAVRVQMNDTGSEGTGNDDSNDLDAWNLAATYSVQGFTVAGTYNVLVEGLGDKELKHPTTRAEVTATPEKADEDLTAWTMRLGYTQDNWYVTGWYGQDSDSNAGEFETAAGSEKAEDTEILSLAAGVAVDKVNLYTLYETRESLGINRASTNELAIVEDNYGTVGVQYNLGARSRVWIEYAARDLESNDDAEDSINIGLQHDF